MAAAGVQEYEKGVQAALRAVAVYCGEDWDENDPSRTLRIVRDFLALFDRVLLDIRVRAPPPVVTASSARGGD